MNLRQTLLGVTQEKSVRLPTYIFGVKERKSIKK